MSDLKIISLKNGLYQDVKKNEVITKAVSRVSELGLTDIRYKNDNEFLVLICNIIEYLIVKKDNLNKKDIVIEIFKRLFAVNVQEIENISRNIDFIHLNGNIKKQSMYKIFKVGIKEWFKKKLL